MKALLRRETSQVSLVYDIIPTGGGFPSLMSVFLSHGSSAAITERSECSPPTGKMTQPSFDSVPNISSHLHFSNS